MPGVGSGDEDGDEDEDEDEDEDGGGGEDAGGERSLAMRSDRRARETGSAARASRRP